MIQKLFLILALTTATLTAVVAQNTLEGRVTEAENGVPVPDAAVIVTGTDKFAATDAEGRFVITGIKSGKITLAVSHAGFVTIEQMIDVRQTATGVNEVSIAMQRDQTSIVSNTGGDIPTVTLDEAESETEGAGEVANLLHASRDIFQTLSGYGWSPFRFRERGYESEHFPLLLNGIGMNDPETGNTFFGEFGGLNDVLRNRNTSIGIEASEFAFNEIGGATNLDTRASTQRKQIRFSQAFSNRTYRYRTMLTMSTGLMPGGWAVTLSGSKRWADEGYVPGTFFDGYSYFASIDKKFGEKHGLNLTVLGAPTVRGRSSDSFREMYEIAGTNFYNPAWGYQNGEKRNANISRTHQPIAILRYDFKSGVKTNVTLSTYAQGGKNGYTRLEWYNDINPSPDYNRILPSSYSDLSAIEEEAKWRELLTNNESLRQINWDRLYTVNYGSYATIENADGVEGNTVSGRRARYVLEDRRSDSRELGSNLIWRQTLTDRITLQAGGNYLWYLGRNFKTAEDLLGADFWVDVNKFAETDFPGEPERKDNDMAVPNNIVREGEVFGYDYDENIRRAGAWAQLQYNLPKVQFFVGGEGNQTRFWRTGYMQNGVFADNSLGDSDKLNFNTYGAKGGVTYKVNGRNYLYINGFYGTKALQFRDVFLSARVQNGHIEDPKPYGITAGEAGYMLRSPYIKARITGYYTRFNDMIESATLFSPNSGGFGTLIMEGVDQLNTGIEAGVEARVFTRWTVSGATNLGYYRYVSRPSLSFYQDNRKSAVNDWVVYQNNYLVPRTPQTLGAISLRHEGRKFWFASVTLNYADDLYYDFDRTLLAREFVGEVYTQGLQPGDDDYESILAQKKAPAAYTVDVFGGKSWRIAKKYFIYLNVGINNVLDNQDIIISGRYAYQSAFRDLDDLRRYQNEITYAFGLNYFASITFRM